MLSNYSLSTLTFPDRLSENSCLAEEDRICLAVLSRNIESVELQAQTAQQRLESSLDLERSQSEALTSVEEQVNECQSYIDQLELTPDRLQVTH